MTSGLYNRKKSTKMKIAVTILIPVFNGIHHTKKCITGLYNMIEKIEKTDRIAVVVIDDGSKDGTGEWIRDNFPKVKVLQGDGTLWWSGGINMGIKYALDELKTEYILWWNNDIKPAPDYLKQLLEIIDKEEVYIGGSKIYYAGNEQLIWSMGGKFDTRSGKKFMLGMNEYDNESYNHEVDADWLPGMGTFIHKSVFEKIGFVDESMFPQYHGDSDFTFRAKLAGYSIKVYPELKIWNDKSNSGLLHQDSAKQLIKTLNDVKSNYHIMKDIQFYRRFATSSFAYQTLAHKYCYYIGGFIKWKFLNMLGFTKKGSV
jgi:GT2 family glycosyltransferase